MYVNGRALGREHWERLGLSTSTEGAETPSISLESLRVYLERAARAGQPVELARFALIALEGDEQLDVAALVEQGLTEQPALRSWILLQLALVEGDEQAQQRALAQLHDPVTDASGLLAAVVGHFLADGDPPGAAPGAGGMGAQLCRMLPLALAGRWQELARDEAPGSGPVRQVLAFVRGDLCDDRAGQLELASGGADADADQDVYRAELELEIALATDSGGALGLALEHRAAAVVHNEALVAATRVFGALRTGDDQAAPAEDGALGHVAAREAWRELCRLMRRARAARSADKAAVATLYLEQASDCDGRVGLALRRRAAELFMAGGDWRRAWDILGAEDDDALGLGRNSEDLTCVQRLLRLVCAAQLSDWDGVTSLLGELAACQSEPSERHLLHLLAVLVAAKHLQGQRESLERLSREVVKDAAAPFSPLTAILHTVLRRAGEGRLLAQSYAALTAAGPAESPPVLHFAQGLSELADGQSDRALSSFAAEQRVGDGSACVAGVTAVAYAGKQRWNEAVSALEQLADRAAPEDRAALLRLAAHVAVVSATAVPRGLQLLELGLELQPDDRDMLSEAAALSLRIQRPRQAVDLIERLAALEGEGEAADDLRARLLCVTGEVHADDLDDPAAAVDCFSRAVELRPKHTGCLQRLHDTLSELGRHRELPRVVQLQLDAAAGETERLPLLIRLAEIHLRLWRDDAQSADADACIDACQRVIESDADHEAAVELLRQICGAARQWGRMIDILDVDSSALHTLRALREASTAEERWDKLAQVCRNLGRHEPEAKVRMEMALEAGDVYRDRLQQLEPAEVCYREALERVEALSPLQRLAQLCRQQERWDELIPLLERALPLSDEDGRCALHRELGQLLEQQSRLQEAVTHFNALSELTPRDIDVLRTLERLLESTRDDDALAIVLQRQLELLAGEDGELDVMLRLAAVQQRRQDSAAALELAGRLHRDHVAHTRAFEVAERTYGDQQQFADLCQLYQQRTSLLLDREDGAEEAVSLLRRKASCELKQLEQPAQAVESLIQLLEVRPDDAEALGEVAQLLTAAEQWQQLLTVYERCADTMPAGPAQLDVLRAAALLATERLGDQAAAERLFERVHEIDPSDEDAFKFLERKLERKKDHRQLIDLLLDRAKRIDDDEEISSCYLRAASVSEQIGDVDLARDLYHRALAIKPDSRRALDALARIHEAMEQWDDFLAITRRQIQLEERPKQKALLHFKCGSVLETKYKEDDDAEQAYRMAVKTSPKCLPAIHSLRDLYARREQWANVIATLEVEARIWEDRKGRAAVLAQIAEIYSRNLDDAAKALQYYRKALDANPENITAALALFDACLAADRLAEARKLGAVCARQIRLRASTDRQASFYVKWARVLRLSGAPGEAARYLARALEIGSDQLDAQHELVSLCREAPESYAFADLIQELLTKAAKRNNVLSEAVLTSGLGSLAESREDVQAALALYRRSVDLGGERIELVRPLADLLVLIGKEQEATELVERCRTPADESPAEEWTEATLWLIAHDVYWRGDYVRGVELCQEVLARDSESVAARRWLGRLAMLQGRHNDAHTEHQRVLQQISDKGSERRSIARQYQYLALASAAAGSPRLAASHWRRATVLEPEWEAPYRARFRHLIQEGNLQLAARAVDGAAEAVGDQSSAVRRMRAELACAMGDRGEAIALYTELVQREEATEEDVLVLVRQLASAGRPDEGAALLRWQIQRQVDYAPAYQELMRLETGAEGNALAGRCRQMLELCWGEPAGELPLLVPRSFIKHALWKPLISSVEQHPLDAVWQIARHGLVSQAPAAAKPHGDEALQEILGRLAKAMDVELRVQQWDEAPRPWQIDDSVLYLSPAAAALPLRDRALLAARAAAAIRWGHGALFGLQDGRCISLLRDIATLTTQPDQLPPTVVELWQRLSARRQKQLAQVVRSHQGVVTQSALELALSYAVVTRSLERRVSLLLTDAIDALYRVVGIEEGLPADVFSDGGLLTAVESLEPMVGYVFSEEYDGVRRRLARQAE